MRKLQFKLFLILSSFAMACNSSNNVETELVSQVVDANDIELLIDGSLETVYESAGASISFVVEIEDKVAAYSFYATEPQSKNYDPTLWIVYGSNDKNEWIEIYKRNILTFSKISRALFRFRKNI